MIMHRRTFLAASAAVAAAPAVARAETDWTPRASMPWPTQEIYCAALDGAITVAGGLVRSASGGLHINDRTGIYDVAADRWSEGPRLPQPRHHPMLAAAAGRVWAFGGYDRRDGEWTAMTDIWAIDRGVWAQVGQMPERLCETVGLSLGDRVHLVTGRSPKGEKNGQWNDQGDVATHLIFDAAGNRWETARPVPMARNSAAGVVLDGKLYVAGGRTVEGGGTGRLDRYDPTADSWDTLAPIPTSSATGKQVGGGLAMAEAGGRLVAFGGEWFEGRGGGVFAETWLYDPARDAWSAGPSMRTPRHGLAAACVNGTVYAIGGGEVASGGKASGIVEALSL